MANISKVLDEEFAAVVTQLFQAARNLGFDMDSDADVERLNRITDGGRIRRSHKNDRKGEAKACREIAEYAAANLTERVLADAFHFLFRYDQARKCSSFGDNGCHSEADLIKHLLTLNWLVGFVQAYSGDRSDGECVVLAFLSENGRIGAEKRHAPMTELRSWAIEKYRADNWPSANAAAHALKDAVIAHGNTINAHLSKENAQRTIAEWFRKSA